MAHGYGKGEKFRGGNHKSHGGDGPGKNARHGDGENHSQKHKGSQSQGEHGRGGKKGGGVINAIFNAFQGK